MHGARGQFQEIAITAAANVYASPRVAPLLVLGFASGLPLALTSGTLQAWATVENVPLQQIGFLTLVGTAYTLKFLWAPLVDRYAPPLLGRRRGWMLLTQVLLALGIMAMGLLSPSSALLPLALLAVTVAFLSATQDIAFDAYCTDVLRKDERGAGAAIRVMGYRLAMIVSGGLALILADQWLGWGYTYMLMGALMLACALATLWAPERGAGAAAAQPAPGGGRAAARVLHAARRAGRAAADRAVQAGRRVRRRAVHHLPAAARAIRRPRSARSTRSWASPPRWWARWPAAC